VKTAFLTLAIVLIGLAALISTVGGSWNTFGHHTALSDFALFFFFASFLPIKSRKRRSVALESSPDLGTSRERLLK
jgi:hypothetical protein